LDYQSVHGGGARHAGRFRQGRVGRSRHQAPPVARARRSVRHAGAHGARPPDASQRPAARRSRVVRIGARPLGSAAPPPLPQARLALPLDVRLPEHHLAAGRRLLSDSRAEERHTPQMVIRMNKEAREIFPDAHFLAYGLGWLLRDYHGKQFVGHGGAIDGMRAEIGLVPEARVGVVVLCNLDGTSFPAAILYRALDAYLGAPPRDWSAVLLAAERKAEARGDSVDKAFEAKRVRDTHPSLPLERYAGTYVDSLYGTVEIAEQGYRLVARWGPAFTGDLTHWHLDTL